MSTNDVPGANPINHDQLAMGCWAEHSDGSLIFVESTEAERVIYVMFDLARTPIVQYRDAMHETAFKKAFTWRPESLRAILEGDPENDDYAEDDDYSVVPNERWTWHDKTPFPWNRVIQLGVEDGVGFASAQDQLDAARRVHESRSAAQRVAEALHLRAGDVPRRAFSHLAERTVVGGTAIMGKIKRAVAELRK